MGGDEVPPFTRPDYAPLIEPPPQDPTREHEFSRLFNGDFDHLDAHADRADQLLGETGAKVEDGKNLNAAVTSNILEGRQKLAAMTDEHNADTLDSGIANAHSTQQALGGTLDDLIGPATEPPPPDTPVPGVPPPPRVTRDDEGGETIDRGPRLPVLYQQPL